MMQNCIWLNSHTGRTQSCKVELAVEVIHCVPVTAPTTAPRCPATALHQQPGVRTNELVELLCVVLRLEPVDVDVDGERRPASARARASWAQRRAMRMLLEAAKREASVRLASRVCASARTLLLACCLRTCGQNCPSGCQTRRRCRSCELGGMFTTGGPCMMGMGRKTCGGGGVPVWLHDF